MASTAVDPGSATATKLKRSYEFRAGCINNPVVFQYLSIIELVLSARSVCKSWSTFTHEFVRTLQTVHLDDDTIVEHYPAVVSFSERARRRRLFSTVAVLDYLWQRCITLQTVRLCINYDSYKPDETYMSFCERLIRLIPTMLQNNQHTLHFLELVIIFFEMFGNSSQNMCFI